MRSFIVIQLHLAILGRKTNCVFSAPNMQTELSEWAALPSHALKAPIRREKFLTFPINRRSNVDRIRASKAGYVVDPTKITGIGSDKGSYLDQLNILSGHQKAIESRFHHVADVIIASVSTFSDCESGREEMNCPATIKMGMRDNQDGNLVAGLSS